VIYRLVSASILTVWLALLALDVGDDCGMIKHIREDVDQVMDTVLADFGRAIKNSDASQIFVSAASRPQFVAVYLSILHNPGILSVPSGSLGSISQETQLLNNSAKIHQIFEVFLI
jgi:hypothetical protein